jgi:hypothetical protein
MADPTTPTYRCPRCSTTPGAGQFCPTCGLDFAAYPPVPSVAPVAAPVAPVAAPAWPQQPAMPPAPAWPQQPYGSAPYGAPPPGQYPGQYPMPYGGYPAPAAKPAVTIGSIGMLAGAGVLIVGSFLPWASMSYAGTTMSINGTDAGKDGVITLGIGVLVGVAALLAIFGPKVRKPAYAGGVVLALIAGAVAGVDINDIMKTNSSFGTISLGISVGIGLWLAAAGAVIAGVSSLIGLVSRK